MTILIGVGCFLLGGVIGALLVWGNLNKRLAQIPLLEQKMTSDLASAKALYEERLSNQEKLLETERENTRRREAEAVQQAEVNRQEMEKAWQARLDLMKEEFKTLSESILKEKSGALTEVNKAQFSALLEPLSKDMVAFKQAVDSSREKGVELFSQQQAFINDLKKTSSQVGYEARQLATALKGSNKSMGNWGEMILEEMLESVGLKRGINYDCQKMLKDDQGNSPGNTRMIPDVVIHNPGQGDIVVDSKVSLSAYLEYVNADDDQKREDALQRHITSVRNHVVGLAKRDYLSAYEGTKIATLDYVLMFIPNEGSCQLAMNKCENLWQWAFDQRVLIVSPLNLMALLQMIRTYWIKVEQDKNLEAIIRDAGTLLDRLYDFYGMFDDIGKNLENAQAAYGKAVNKLKDASGNQSVAKIGEALRKRGLKINKKRELPIRLHSDEE